MNKTIEYMALGKPVVQFENTEGRFSAQEASLYARPNDVRDFAAKILELLGDPERCKAMGKIGRERVVNELAWSHQSVKLLAAYDAAFKPRSARRAMAGGMHPRNDWTPSAGVADTAPIRVAGDRVEVNRRGAAISVPAVRIGERTIALSGRWLRIASIHDEEWLPALSAPEPELLIRSLRSVTPKADIFTFAHGVSAPEIRHPYPFEWEDAAVVRTTTYADWWTSLRRIVRNDVRRAIRRGVVVQRAAFDDALIRGIKEIYDEVPTRQGRRFWHFGKDLESVRRANATYLETSEFLGAYHEGKLIGFIKIVYVDRVARVMQILAKQRHSDKRPSNALVAKAVEVCCQRGTTHLIYSRYSYGNKGATGLTRFKRRNRFERIIFPRYFVPLTRKGELALALKLHLGFADLLPRRVTRLLLKIRTRMRAPQSPMRNRSPAGG
jgi:hypothetical protein